MAATAASNILSPANLLAMVAWVFALAWGHLSALFSTRTCGKAARDGSPPGGRGELTWRRQLAATPPGRPVCVVTGATSGIGEAAAGMLAEQGFCVILGCRSVARGEEVAQGIRSSQPSAAVHVLGLDLCSPPSILSFARGVGALLAGRHLALLVNNAGALAATLRWTPPAGGGGGGCESTMASNYLGPFLLAQELLPFLGGGRIINVASFTHFAVRSFEATEEALLMGGARQVATPGGGARWRGRAAFVPAHAYQTSKLCVLLFSYELHRRLSAGATSSHVSVIAVDPGLVDTRILREFPPWLRVAGSGALRAVGLMRPPAKGALAVVAAALSPPEVSGVYVFGPGGRIVHSSRLSRRAALGRRLWEASEAAAAMWQRASGS